MQYWIKITSIPSIKTKSAILMVNKSKMSKAAGEKSDLVESESPESKEPPLVLSLKNS